MRVCRYRVVYVATSSPRVVATRSLERGEGKDYIEPHFPLALSKYGLVAPTTSRARARAHRHIWNSASSSRYSRIVRTVRCGDSKSLRSGARAIRRVLQGRRIAYAAHRLRRLFLPLLFPLDAGVIVRH